MTDATVAVRIHAYIRDEILYGQDADLTPTTPLLELGILSSFALLRLVAHINGTYGTGIRPDEISGHDFRTIESITRLVSDRLPPERPKGQDLDAAILEGPAVFETPECAQLFLLFTGLGQHLATGRRVVNWPVSRFFTESGLTDRNVIVFGDPYGQSYRRGVSAALPTPERVCEWVEAWIGERAHIDEISCIGISAGGPIAMTMGERLEARTVWAFGPRPVRRDFVDNVLDGLLRLVEDATGKTLAELEQEMTEADCTRIDAICTPEVLDRYTRNYLDPETLLDRAHLDELVETLSRPNGRTRHQVVYCPRDPCDAHVVERLRACPTVAVVEVEPSDDPPRPWLFSRWVPPADWMMRDHLVADTLLRRRQLASFFPACRASRRRTARDA